jgi:hypothetical protein
MAFYFDDPDYNPRRGAGNSGRVRKKDFSIDGKSWDYRDPYNAEQLRRQNMGHERSRITVNENSMSMTNPLYDYDYGRVRDAAKELGINNVNSKKEVKDILDLIRGNYKKPKKDEEPKNDYKPTELPKDPYEGGDKPPKSPTKPGGMPKPGDFGTNRPPGSIPYIPPSSDEGRAAYGTAGSGGKTSLDTAIESVADYGNRATDDYFGRFLPEMGLRNTNEAKATGRSLLSSIQNFTGKVPQLGDPKDLFKYYMGKID